ncbi:zinc-binding dehydrogenase [Streptomyces sp. 3MP-14]|uniref:Zinc-binding dehydrogenase n=1 Tax=Streptomyces mimosae TaxID=2586635 RepID=A0A5N5ZTG9_9ACTN|nr:MULTISPECIES: zinc-binding dehydrogenase [Streptomyces]KAB8159535.1 zinc-binding dehydrogenase [Streptomyces mimosae]KAB8172813.1 zinc-binding dehydrogenase [Streptomyces sp. 3MP-14]
MEAAFVERLGPPGEIRLGLLPRPAPGPTDVLVRVELTTVNPVDALVRSGAFVTPVPLPLVLGRDAVGTVAEAGEGAGFTAGEPVWTNSLGHDGRQGAAAQYAVVPADRLYRLPAGVDPTTAVTVLHPGATAWLALFRHGRLRPGETVVVVGAAGNVGGAVVTFAAEAGARVLALARAADADHCRALGAAEVLDYRDPALTGALARAAPDGVGLVVDAAGRNDLAWAVELLARRGRLVLLAGAGTRPTLPVGAFYRNDLTVRGFVISNATVDELAEAAAGVNRLLALGRLSSRRATVRPLSAIVDEHRRVEDGTAHGRRVALRTSAALHPVRG